MFFNFSKFTHELFVHFLQLFESRFIDFKLVLVVQIVQLGVVVEPQDGSEGNFRSDELDDLDRMSVSALVQNLQSLLHVIKEKFVGF